MKPKKPGIFKDTWRSTPTTPPPSKPPAEVIPITERKEEAEDFGPFRRSSLQLPGYGGISLDGTNNPESIGPHILDFCVRHLSKLDPILVDHGILVTNEVIDPKTISFYIKRPDGWALAVPNAETRQAGVLQLIQAFLKMIQDPQLAVLLKDYGLQPYRF
jgi:hypothetical protein